MKIVHADPWHVIYRGACPSCDLGLDVVVPSRADSPIIWHHDERQVDTCPRCRFMLPGLELVDAEPRLVAA